MADYISREAAAQILRKAAASHYPTPFHVGLLAAARAIEAIPAANVRENVKAFNLRKEYPSLFKCSRCGWGCDDTYYCDTRNFNFCPNCGADMRGAE